MNVCYRIFWRALRCNGAVLRSRRAVVAAVMVMAMSPALRSATPPEQDVLVVHSYRPDNRYTQLQESGLRRELTSPGGEHLSIGVEYLHIDSNEDYRARAEWLTRYFRTKYTDSMPHVVVTTDTPALEFVLNHLGGLFVDVPVVFSGLMPNRLDLSQFQDVTGVMEVIDARGTIELIQKLHPGMDRLVIVRDRLGHSEQLEALVHDALLQLGNPPRVEWLVGPWELELKNKLSKLTPDSPVLLLSHHATLTTSLPIPAIPFEEVARRSGTPIYTLYDAYMGRGVVGGRVASGEISGHRAGQIVLNILRNGERASDIPVVPSATVYMFDARELRRWKIPEKLLPPSSIIQFRPMSFLAQYRPYVIGGFLLSLLQAAVIVLLVRNIARRRRVEKELSDSRQRLRTIFEHAPVGLARTAPDGRFLDANPALIRLYGYPREKLLSLTFFDITHPDDLALSRDVRDRALKGDFDTLQFEKRYVRADGATIWCVLTVSVVRDECGRTDHFMAAIHDISERRKSQEAIEQQARLRESIIATAAEGICLWHRIEEPPHTRFVIWNKRMTEITGYTMDEVNRLGWHLTVYREPAEQKRAWERMLRSLEGDSLHQEEWAITRKDGQERVISLSTSVVDTLDGHRGVVAVMQDVTDRIRAEAEARESAARFRTVLENLERVAVQAYDANGRITFWNHASEEFYGFTAREALGRNINELRRPVPTSAEADRDHEPAPPAGEVEILRKDGSRITVFSSLIEHERPGREPEYFCFDVDISARKRAELMIRNYTRRLEYNNEELVKRKLEAEQLNNELRQLAADLEKANTQAQASNRAKSEFLANMSHEIRTPMAAILGYADNLLDRDLSELDRQHAIETIRRNGEHLLSLINDILDLSKIEAGRMTVEHIACPLESLLRETYMMMKVRADAKKLQMVFRFATRMPGVIESDPLRLRQILINLLANAIKFTHSGKVELVVSTLDAHPGLLCFDVIDTGIGMTREQSSVLFHAFSQGDTSTTRQFGGTGLGLVISVRLARLLGGDLSLADSHPGQGTTFRLVISSKVPDESGWIEPGILEVSTHGESTHSAAPQDVPKLFGRRILVAEDSPDNQRLVEHILRLEGAEVTIVEDGRAALDTAMKAWQEKRPFDVILMDMQMPVMDGYTATRHLRERGYTGLIIALTAHAMREDRLRCLEAGCDEYTTKPIKRNHLLDLISMSGQTQAVE